VPRADPAVDSADIAFVNVPALVALSRSDPGKLARVRALAALQPDTVQVVVRRDSGIRELHDLAGRRVYKGRDGSGTRIIADQILEAAGVTADAAARECSYLEAAKGLISGSLDAAVFAAGTPNGAVTAALTDGTCRLIDVEIGDAWPEVYETWTIPSLFYEYQEDPVRTLRTWAVLCCRADRDDNLAGTVLEVLHDKIDSLLLADSKLQEIRLDRADEGIPRSLVDLHPGAEDFWERESGRLRIATASVSGRYYRIGRGIQDLLARCGILSRVIHTEGSVRNVQLLGEERPTIAILQRDVAIAYGMDAMDHVYGIGEEPEIPRVGQMQRIASLHEEKAQILARRPPVGEIDDVRDLEGMTISIGPALSGSRLVAKAILAHCGVKEQRNWLTPSVPESVERLRQKQLEGLIFLTADPSEALQPLLAGEDVRLLSVDAGRLARILGPVLRTSEIGGNSYRCLKGKPPVQTISTNAVLVTDDDVDPELVEEITTVLIEGLDYLPLDIEKKDLAADLLSLPLHPGARAAYRTAGMLSPDPDPPDLLRPRLDVAWKFMACLVLLVGGNKGLLKLRRDRISGRIERLIHSVSVDVSEPRSVTKLRRIQSDLRGRVRMAWWQWRQLDRHRWQPLNALIVARIGEAKERLFRAMVADIRALGANGNPEQMREAAEATRDRLWKHLENGELDTDQLRRLLEMLEEHTAAAGAG
jgi:TRAP transporter TAXI family solute receptor